MVDDYNALAARAQTIYDALPAAKRDAFYELVLFPTKASAQVNELYVAAGKNALYAAQGRASTNDLAAKTQALFQADQDLMAYFNKTFAGGKWDHFMDQVHIGYRSWNEPRTDNLDAIPLTRLTVPTAAAMAVAVEGSPTAWLGTAGQPTLPAFDALNQQRHYIDVFNRGRTAFPFTATASAPWIVLSDTHGTIAQGRPPLGERGLERRPPGHGHRDGHDCRHGPPRDRHRPRPRADRGHAQFPARLRRRRRGTSPSKPSTTPGRPTRDRPAGSASQTTAARCRACGPRLPWTRRPRCRARTRRASSTGCTWSRPVP